MYYLPLPELPNGNEINRLLSQFADAGGVLDYVPIACEETPSEATHRAAAIAAMKRIDHGLATWATERATPSNPAEKFFRITMDTRKLTGQQISYHKFWGSDDVALRQMGPNSWSVPNVDGYKRAFFIPPYSLSGSADVWALFEEINFVLFGCEPEQCTVYSWSTDWSNYFDAGREWWGAFYWTVFSAETKLLTTIGASATD